jgi:hypothetical protein
MNFQDFKLVDDDDDIKKFNKDTISTSDIYKTSFLFTQDHRNNYPKMADIALKGVHRKSDLSKMYFSQKNFNRIQKMIKKKIFEKTKGQYKLDVDQDINMLFTIMKAVYFEHAKFLPNQIVRQVKELNKKTINNIYPGILSNIKQYFGYLKDIGTPIKPINRPINTGNRGRNQLKSRMTF